VHVNHKPMLNNLNAAIDDHKSQDIS